MDKISQKLTVTSNGVSIYSYPNPSLHGFHLSLFVRSGSMHELEEENGIAHFFEHVAIRNVNALMGGELYRTLYSGLVSDDVSVREMTAIALRIGLDAIEGRQISGGGEEL